MSGASIPSGGIAGPPQSPTSKNNTENEADVDNSEQNGNEAGTSGEISVAEDAWKKDFRYVIEMEI